MSEQSEAAKQNPEYKKELEAIGKELDKISAGVERIRKLNEKIVESENYKESSPLETVESVRLDTRLDALETFCNVVEAML